MAKSSSALMMEILALALVLSCWLCHCKSQELLMGCDEIYVVREGETLQGISEKCGDLFLVEENPHINDPDDVFPGLVIKITPFHHFVDGFRHS